MFSVGNPERAYVSLLVGKDLIIVFSELSGSSLKTSVREVLPSQTRELFVIASGKSSLMKISKGSAWPPPKVLRLTPSSRRSTIVDGVTFPFAVSSQNDSKGLHEQFILLRVSVTGQKVSVNVIITFSSFIQNPVSKSRFKRLLGVFNFTQTRVSGSSLLDVW